MTLQVLGAGFGRTGTLSLRAALDVLGFAPCYHMVEVAKHPSHAGTWVAAARGAPVEWPLLLRGYAAAVDWPAAAFWRELLHTFPAARVVLTVRDSSAWYASFHDTILAKTAALLPPKDSPLRAIHDLTQELILDGVFAGRAVDAAHAIAVYEAHNRAVIDSVAPDRLLVHDLTAGWEPLCRFLDRPVPREPFPHLNTRALFLRQYLGRRARHAARRSDATPS
jgi:Sulfotransferase domain